MYAYEVGLTAAVLARPRGRQREKRRIFRELSDRALFGTKHQRGRKSTAEAGGLLVQRMRGSCFFESGGHLHVEICSRNDKNRQRDRADRTRLPWRAYSWRHFYTKQTPSREIGTQKSTTASFYLGVGPRGVPREPHQRSGDGGTILPAGVLRLHHGQEVLWVARTYKCTHCTLRTTKRNSAFFIFLTQILTHASNSNGDECRPTATGNKALRHLTQKSLARIIPNPGATADLTTHTQTASPPEPPLPKSVARTQAGLGECSDKKRFSD